MLAATDTAVSAEITVSSQAAPGAVQLTITTFYGSTSAQADLTLSRLSLGPALTAITPGSSGNITATIYPALGRTVAIQLKSGDPTVASVPQAATIPSNGTAVFPVSALTAGEAVISAGSPSALVVVTSETFTAQPGEQLKSYARPISVYIDSPTFARTGLRPVTFTLTRLPPGPSPS
jgi:hypothetical protein